MSDDETQIVQTEDGQMLTAEYRDGQLKIVEVTEFDKENESHILSDLSSDETRYVQVLDGDKGIVHLDLVSLIKNSNTDGASTYQVVGTSSDDGDTTISCVLADEDQAENQDTYVFVNTEKGQEPVVYLQSSLQQINTRQNVRAGETTMLMTPDEILAKAKILQKARSLDLNPRYHKSGRKRKSDLPPPMELLASPNFKLYLYSCKLCCFKCNAMQEMSLHKATDHAPGRSRGVGGGRSSVPILQCARCPFKGSTHTQLMKHISDKHMTKETDISELILGGTDGADVLVCGACGFESGSGTIFKKHVESVHAVATSSFTTTVVTIEEDSS